MQHNSYTGTRDKDIDIFRGSLLCSLLDVYYLPSIVLNMLHVIKHILIITMVDSFIIPFSDEETESQRLNNLPSITKIENRRARIELRSPRAEPVPATAQLQHFKDKILI